MDCSTARLLLAFSRPKAAELETAEVQALNDHLADCTECEALAQSEQQVEHLLGLAMPQVPVPSSDLRQRLLTQLETQRRSWYRRLPQRHPRLTAAAAAVLLFVVGLAVYEAVRPPQRIDLAAIAAGLNARVPASPDEIQKAFAEDGFIVIVPPDFNYQYLARYELQDFAGVRVPYLLFVRGQNLAYVYILSASQFDVRAAVDQPREGSGRFTVELRPGPANSNVAYLIQYTGGSLEGFCRDHSSG
jgi:hypothetical protein